MDRGVFLSYRRSDTAGHAGRLSDDLARHFRRPVVFRDIDSIDAGSDFVHALETAIGQASVAIVLIGDTWLSAAAGDGSRRLDDPQDHVRREVAMALANPRLTVVPVLVEDATMPTESELPEPLQRLTRLQAIELSERRWDYDVGELAGVLRQAGITVGLPDGVPRWLVALLLALLAAAISVAIWCWTASGDPLERYTGLWHLPNGNFWTVRREGEGLWVEETHHQSQQVWKRGAASVDGDVIEVALELVFDDEPFHYAHALRLSDDKRTLVGIVRRSDRKTGRSLALSRARP